MNQLKGLNEFGVQDDSTLKVDIDHVLFQKPHLVQQTNSTSHLDPSQQGPIAYYVKIRIDNDQR